MPPTEELKDPASGANTAVPRPSRQCEAAHLLCRAGDLTDAGAT